MCGEVNQPPLYRLLVKVPPHGEGGDRQHSFFRFRRWRHVSKAIDSTLGALPCAGLITFAHDAKHAADILTVVVWCTHRHHWVVFVRPDAAAQIRSVVFRLHPTFKPRVVEIKTPPFEVLSGVAYVLTGLLPTHVDASLTFRSREPGGESSTCWFRSTSTKQGGGR